MTTRKIKIFDTTLRDGEQTPGAHLSVNHKVEIAQGLERLGVDIIEVGFPASSNADQSAAVQISQKVKNATVCALSRAVKNDIDAAWDAITLESYNISAVTEGADALGEVRVQIKSGDLELAGRSVSSDIIKASIRAYLHAVNKWLKLSEN